MFPPLGRRVFEKGKVKDLFLTLVPSNTQLYTHVGVQEQPSDMITDGNDQAEKIRRGDNRNCAGGKHKMSQRSNRTEKQTFVWLMSGKEL